VLRSSDTVCRQGGDEFVLLLSGHEDRQHVQSLATKVLAQVAREALRSQERRVKVIRKPTSGSGPGFRCKDDVHFILAGCRDLD
jgi:GGDEF domain-containing protein